MKTVCIGALLMMSTAIAITAPARAAPGQLPLKLSDYVSSGGVAEPEGVPVNLLPSSFASARPTMKSTVGRVTCDEAETQKICDLRAAAAQRAWEVTEEENKQAQMTPAVFSTANSGVQQAQPMGLLIPVGLIPVRAIACDPALSTEECARLEKRIPSNPQGPLPPSAPAPTPETPSASRDPSPAIEPVPVTPPSVIPPPPTGDNELVQPPPKTGSKMPVIKPKAAPPVNPQPE